jgi:hypothetical protein
VTRGEQSIGLAEPATGSTQLWCPSAQPDMDEAVLFGVVTGPADRPIVGYLEAAISVDDTIEGLAAPVDPREVFRFSAPCAETRCIHFEDARCSLAERIVATPVEIDLRAPKCAIRPRCRWWNEQGLEACKRCPMVITLDYAPSTAMTKAASKSTP